MNGKQNGDDRSASAVGGNSEDRPRITRRAFNTTLVGGLALAAAGVSAIAPKSAMSAPKRGGFLRVATHTQSTNDTFDATKYIYTNDYIRATSVYNTLTQLDEHSQPQPELAESFEPDKTATRWVFKIRKGVTYQDGTPLTMDDIIYSILRHKDPKLGSSARPLVANVSDVKSDGPNSIVVELASPDVDLPIMIGIFQFTIVKNGTTDFSNPIGTGPFKVKEFNPGVRCVFVRNENYWKEGRPYVDQIELFYILDPVARVNALLSGDAQMVTDVQGTAIDQVKGSGAARIFTTNCPRYTSIQGAADRAPSNNLDLRMAIAYLMDRKRLLDTVMKGQGLIANDHPIMSTSAIYNSELVQRALDPDKAKYHLGKSGIGSAKIEVNVSDAAPFSVEIGQLLQREAMQIGLNLDLKREPADSYWNAVAGKRPFTAINFNPRPTYNILLSLAWKSGVPWNFSHYSNPELDKLIDKARATLDQTERTDAYHQIQKIIYDSGYLMLPCFISYVDGISNKVQGLTPVPVGNLNGFNFADKVWIES
ncbi:MAG: ABC transporter substrate-binding protein [Alphaproteobacteria bacterium]